MDRFSPTMEIRFVERRNRRILQQKWVALSGKEEWRDVPLHTDDGVEIVEGEIVDAPRAMARA
jgi:hypothetical protein